MSGMKFLVSVLMIAILTIATISLFWENNILVTILFLMYLAVIFRFWHGRRDIIFFMVGFSIGPSMEIACIFFGVWMYSNPTFLIPAWLPLGWGTAGILLGRLSEYLNEKWGSGK
jgi:hypothetical protein